MPRTARSWVRRRRWEAATSPALLAEASWAEVRDTAVDLQMDRSLADHGADAAFTQSMRALYGGLSEETAAGLFAPHLAYLAIGQGLAVEVGKPVAAALRPPANAPKFSASRLAAEKVPLALP